MVIKKASNKELFFEGLKSKILVKNDGGLVITQDPENIKLDKPGEYEYGDSQFVLLEIAPDVYTGKTNFARISLENIDIAVVMSDIPADRDHLKDVSDAHILAVSADISIDTIKKLLTYFEPQILVLFNVADAAQIQKDLSLPNLTTDKSLKIKSADLKSENESVVMMSYLLS